MKTSHLIPIVFLLLGQVTSQPLDPDDFSSMFPSESADHNGITYRTAYACQGQTLNISCPNSGDVIKVIRANYGRFSIAICNEEGRTDFSVNCLAPNSFRVMQERCNFRSSCVGDASLFQDQSDPCPSTPKYLEVHYACIRVSTTTTTTKRPLPPWMRTTRYSTTSTTIIPPTDQEAKDDAKRRRVPITLPPTRPQESPESIPGVRGNGQSKTKSILNKFLSSSISSTNIMDTSETPVTLLDGKRGMEKDGESTAIMVDPQTTSSTSTTPVPTAKVTTATVPPSTTPKAWIRKNHVVDFPTTEPPKPNPKASLVDERSFSTNPLLEYPGYCSPRRVRTLDWSWTRPNTVAVMPCPLTTSGMARWKCGHNGRYVTPHPDLSQCQSIWLKKIRNRLIHEQLSLVHVARDILYHLGSHPLFGGDLQTLAGVLDLMTSGLRGELSGIPTREQRKAVVAEYVQSAVHVSSQVLEDRNVISGAWKDLPSLQERLHVFSAFLTVLEDSGLLLLEGAVQDNLETTVQGKNVLISVRNVSFRQMLPMNLPSEAALAAKDWSGRTESVMVPPVVLMENMERGGGANVVFVMIKNGKLIVNEDPNRVNDSAIDDSVRREPVHGESLISDAKEPVPKNMISHVLSVALGGPNAKHHEHFLPKTSKPLEITFQHLIPNVTSPQCVFWHPRQQDWSLEGCQLVKTNQSHSICSCEHLSSYALVDGGPLADLSHDWPWWMWIAIILVISLVSVGIFILLAFICIVCKRRRGWQKPLKDEAMESRPGLCCCLKSTKMGTSHSDSFQDHHDMLESPTFHQTNPRLRDAPGGHLDRGMHLTLRPMISSPMPSADPPPDLVRMQQFNTQPFPQNTAPRRNNLHYQPQPQEATPWHHHTTRPTPSNAAARNKWHGPGSSKVVETPERPLLTDFPSPGQFSNTNHIYMEVQDPWHQGHYDMDPNYSPTTLMSQHQPIHLPIMVAESSNSSQSSGYASATFQNQQQKMPTVPTGRDESRGGSSQVFSISSRGHHPTNGRLTSSSRNRPNNLSKGTNGRAKYQYAGREDHGLRSPGSMSVEQTQLI
ncbi:latrophilin Cirl-like isoform X2 [Tigriopus californicus]|uniref:latrophilin Cirl-like isoform X2 n=1 Tax=Tigriopus californicus TaxID=6832 RepID=UPI0027DA6893|nr:latrophilin Cirl-like isoform X2 [Tigriopus californicus]